MRGLQGNQEGNINIFVLDTSPIEAAQAAADRHVVKMVLETAQILCTVSARYGVAAPYKATHTSHPCTLWAGETRANWAWLVEHGHALAREYTRRYGRTHASASVLSWAEAHGGRPASGSLTAFAQAMPEAYRAADPVEAYRAYYRAEKARIATWRAPASPPSWWV